MTTDRAVEGEFREHDENALAIVPPKEIALSTQDPTEFLERAVKQADALKRVIESKKLAISIGGRDAKPHVLIDGWQTLMALNGVMPFTLSCVPTRCVPGECQVQKDCRGGRLTVHVVTEIRRVGDGTVLTRVEAECSQHERLWSGRDDFAVISMAQTRGVGKGCRQLFGWVMALAGFSATPAEEIPGHENVRPASAAGPEPVDQRGASDAAPEGRVTRPPTQGAARPDEHKSDSSGPMSEEQRAHINDLRMKCGEPQTVAAQTLLKSWAYLTWSKFLVFGTALQAAAVEEALRA